MAAPKGHKFWMLRSKHGPNAIIQDPVKLETDARIYFAWCDAHPLMEVQYHGKNAKKCLVPKMRAYTLQGLCVYLNISTTRFSALQDKREFAEVYTWICQVIYTQKYEGGAAGLLNANIIARDLGLAEKMNVDSAQTVKFDDDTFIKLLSHLNA
jgi:hypothetical protein